MSRKKAGQKHGIKIANRSYEGVAKFKYLGTTLNRSKLHGGRDYEQTKLGEFLIQFGPKSFVFPSLL
jgi:hypothetical protein